MAQRATGGVAWREERGRHADTVRPPQHHVGDGAGARRRRRRDPPAPRRSLPFCTMSGTRTSSTSWPRSRADEEARDAIRAYLDKYGMRCVGEIDITRPRWSERPTTLLPMILSNIKNLEPGAGVRRFEHGRQEASKKEREVLEQIARPADDGERKAEETERMIDRVRTFIGYREYPKYAMVSRYFVYKRALLDEAERLVQADVLREKEDIFFLTFEELHDVVQTNQVDDELIRRRKDAFTVISGTHATAGAHIGRRVHRRNVPPRWHTNRCAGGPTGLCRNRRRASPSHPGHGGGRSRTGRHPGHGAHRPPAGRPCSSRSLAW